MSGIGSVSPVYRDSFARTALTIPNLVAFWPLGEASGTVAVDVMGATPGAYVNAPSLGGRGPLTGDPAGAIVCTAGSVHHVTANLPAITDTFSIVAWAKHTADVTGEILVSIKAGASVIELLRNSAFKYEFRTPTAGAAYYSVVSAAGTWRMICATISGSVTKTLGVNAVREAMANETAFVAPDTALKIGTRYTPAFSIGGSLSNVLIYARAITAVEELALYLAGTR